MNHGAPASPQPPRTPNGRASRTRQTLRLTHLALHLLAGLLRVLVLFPFLSQTNRQKMRQRWSFALLKALDIRLQRHGPAPISGCLLVANHVSWLDIFVINSLIPAGFISKAEVRRWPAIGWMAARNDTLFLRRGNRRHAELISRDIGAMLQAGHDVALFPEGMTSDGTSVRHFHAKLLQPAITYGCPVQGLAIRYRTADDRYCAAASYEGGISLWHSLKAIIAEPVIIARVDMLKPVVPPPGTDRRNLANDLRAQIAAHVEGQ